MMNHVEDVFLVKELLTKSLFWDIIGHIFLRMPNNMLNDVIVVKEWGNPFHHMR